MSETITVMTLIENSVYARGLLAEHGLAFHIQAGRRSLLFDAGQSDLLLHNALKLGVSLAETEAIVLSHGHNDHTGGLTAAHQAAPKARLFLHRAALSPKFAGNPDGTSRSIGMDEASAETIRRAAKAVVWTSKPAEALDGIFVTGEIPRQSAFEDTGGPFFLDAACAQPDPLLDDQALFFDTQKGLVVLLGCGHAGVVNTLDYVQRLTNGRPIHTILGGLHLGTASPERMKKTIAAFRRWDVQQLAPGHCTSTAAMAQLWTAFPGRCTSCAVGASLVFQRWRRRHRMKPGTPNRRDMALAKVCLNCPVRSQDQKGSPTPSPHLHPSL
jgi:7,8-dihydropterin-6-yl-methyl-4-(beta-D-ribofuranosyl)aminobenzene 5'-phosphate synthase